MLYSTANMGTSTSSAMDMKMKFASILPSRIANGEIGAMRNASSVSLACSRENEGFSINEPAKRKAIHSSPGP